MIIARWVMTVETSLAYELTSLPLSLFNNEYHKMNKAIFSKTSLKVLTDPLDLIDQPWLQSGGGWWMASLHGEVGTRPYLGGDF